LPEKQRKFGKKTIVAVLFILLFTLSLAVVFFYPSPEEENVGYVNVSRSESYWENTLGNVTDNRYLINYGVYALSNTPKVTIKDKTDAGLTEIQVTQDTDNVKVSYDKTTGAITVVVTDVPAEGKVLAQLAFVMDPVDIFAPGEQPTTTVTPAKIYWGDKTEVSVDIAPFTVTRTTNMTEVGVYAWLTDAVTEISNVSTAPQAVCDPPMYQAIWQYKTPQQYSYNRHNVNYTIRLPVTSQSGDVLLRTWVEVRYFSPLRMMVDGTISGADGYFFKVDSSISYQYEKGISASVLN
jgi:hypothetical protein